jgi:hypothetical protein
MFIELGLVVSLRKLGWFGTGDLLTLIASLSAVFLPFLIIGFMLFWGRLRISLRGLMIAVALVSVFMALSVKPLLDFRSMRQASLALLALNTQVSTEQYDYHSLKYRSPTYSQKEQKIAEPNVWIPPWLHYFIKDIQLVPPDLTVVRIAVVSDEQFEMLIQHIHRLPNLESMWISDVSSNNVRRIPELINSNPSIRSVDFRNPVLREPLFGSHWNIQAIGISYWPPVDERKSRLSDQTIVELIQQKGLETLHLSNSGLDESQLKRLAESSTLEKVVVTAWSIEGTRSYSSKTVEHNLDTFRTPGGSE